VDDLKCSASCSSLVWFGSFYVRVSTMTAIYTVGHRYKYTPTNGPRLTDAYLPWWSPIHVLSEVDVPCLNFSERGTELKHWSPPQANSLVVERIDTLRENCKALSRDSKIVAKNKVALILINSFPVKIPTKLFFRRNYLTHASLAEY